jgi:nucleoside-diphosphate-sugar epimerase
MTSPADRHVVFGTGPLASAVARALRRRGHAVTMVNRTGRRPGEVPPDTPVVAGDAYDPAFARTAAQGAAVVFQCAQPPYHKWVERFLPLQASILDAAAAAGAKLVAGENLYMYGDTNGAPMTEDLPCGAHTRKGAVRAEMSRQLLDAHRAGKVRVAMARGSDFFGPGVLQSALGERALVPALRGKSASLLGSLDLPHSYTFIDDFGEAMAILGERNDALGQAWHVPNAPALTQRELMTLVFREIGSPPRMSAAGRGMMRLAGLFVPAARETVEMMYEFEKAFVVDSTRFERAFDMRATPIQKAVSRTVAWYRERFA